jgi:single-strand DNA-binding protein
MSRSLNRLQIIGHAGADAELRTTRGGNTVAGFTIATSHYWWAEDRKQEQTTWHRCVAWNQNEGPQLATQAQNLVKKGTRVFVEGRLNATSWTDKDGATHQGWELIVSQFIVLDRNPAGAAAADRISQDGAE